MEATELKESEQLEIKEEIKDTTLPAPIPEKKKRKKTKKKVKAKGHPLFYKNGYVRFCDEARPLVCEEFPGLDPVEVTKLVASRWFALSQEMKQPYLDVAKLDKDRFKRELKEFNKLHPELEKSSKKKSKAAKPDETKTEPSPATNVPTLPADTTKKEDDVPKTFTGSNCELPIFTDTFLEHNKVIETELKLLRKNNIEIDQQNSVLMKHIENMENGVKKVEGEIAATKYQNIQLEMYLTKMRIILASGLHSLTLPAMKTGATVENIDKYMTEMSSESTALKSPTTVNKARDILRKIDLK